ncbi:MAG: hypothetical protein OET90_10115, partial [Desulfuromonadales bacterium]|nr:hypothetical protein [Desulfuromonadales bacterium]
VLPEKDVKKRLVVKKCPPKTQQEDLVTREYEGSKNIVELPRAERMTIIIEDADRNENDGDLLKYAVIAVPLLVLLVSNFVTLFKIRIESKASIKNELKMNSITIKRDQLSHLYDPVIALSNTNSSVFSSFGPRTFPDDMHKGEEARHIWDNLVDSVIIPNNKEIVKIIKSYSHLMHSEDDFNLYLNFMKHAASYEAFRQTPNEVHSDFSYPSEFLPNVKQHRETVLAELRSLEKQINS